MVLVYDHVHCGGSITCQSRAFASLFLLSLLFNYLLLLHLITNNNYIIIIMHITIIIILVVVLLTTETLHYIVG